MMLHQLMVPQSLGPIRLQDIVLQHLGQLEAIDHGLVQPGIGPDLADKSSGVPVDAAPFLVMLRAGGIGKQGQPGLVMNQADGCRGVQHPFERGVRKP